MQPLTVVSPGTLRKFQKTIAILQGDIENLENERANLENKLDQQPTRKSVIGDLKLGGSKIRTLGGQGTPYGTSPQLSPMGSPYVGRKTRDVAGTPQGDGISLEQNPLLLSRVRWGPFKGRNSQSRHL